VVVLDGQAHLLQVVQALAATSRFACGLNCGKQKRHQNSNDRDDHQQFNEGEGVTLFGPVGIFLPSNGLDACDWVMFKA
jgi:hypothetical protein